LDGGILPGRELIGGKAWSIAEMGALGLNVPPAFVLTTRACVAFLECGDLPAGLDQELAAGIAWLEGHSGRQFGTGPRPLLVSVRSGAPVSMPGMMDTILNLGINSVTERALGEECRDTDFARDTRRRFVEFYAGTVLKTEAAGLGGSADIDAWRLAIAAAAGRPVPEDVFEQLRCAVRAVFESWNSRRARRYREHHGIPDHLGTAVTVQAMVFGNLDERSGTGVLFSRNPMTGESTPFGEFLPRGQGEDVVSGRHTPLALASMRDSVPEALEELLAAARLLEREHGDVQDIEFTVECGRLYLLQTRAAKRAPLAAVRIAAQMQREGLCSADAAFGKITSEQVRLLLSPRLAEGALQGATVLARGDGASPGVGCGVVVTDPERAEVRARTGEAVVLARATTSPDDLHGMIAARAIITEQGGSTSHAAVVSRALGRPCVVGCGAGNLLGLTGRVVTVDGQLGVVLDGRVPVAVPDEAADEDLTELARWADARSPVVVATTAPDDRRVVDLDDTDEAGDPDWLRAFLRTLDPGAAITGSILASESAVAACVAAGIDLLIAIPRLPVLLAAVQCVAGAERSTSKEEQP
jgi:pyruvate,orthophosphate dikinase